MRSRRAESLSTLTHEDASSVDPPPAKRRKKGHSMESLLAREVGLMRDGSGEASASFVGSASGIHFIRAVYGAVGSSATVEETSPATNLVPGEDDRLEAPAPSGAKRRIWQDQEAASTLSTNSESSGGSHPSFDDLLDWTESFFDNWHPPFPVLHAPSVLASLEKLSEHGITKLPSWDLVVVKAIISISLADRRQSSKPLARPIPADLIFNTFDDAHEAILPALTRPATIAGIQAVICVQLFLVSMLRLNTASRLGGLIVQMAFQLGLHRCPSRYRTFPQSERQLRKRIFWSLYCLERYICQAMGLPLTIRDDDADVCHLNEEVHCPRSQQHPPAFNKTRNISEREVSPPPDGRLQLLVFLSQHAQLRGSIIELRNKRVEERDKNPDVAVLINARLTQWWNEVEDFFDQNEPASSSISRLHKVILETLKHESIIMLHRPMLASPKTAASYASAVHACIGAAKSLLSALYSLAEEPIATGTSTNSFSIPMMWPSFTWAVWMSAFILLYATTEGIVNGQVAGRNVDKSLRILNKLASRGSVWPEASAVAIQDLRSILTERNDIPPTPSSTTVRDSTDQLRQTHPQSTPLHQRVTSSTGLQSSSSNGYAPRSIPEELFRAQTSTDSGSTIIQEPPRTWMQSGSHISWHEQQQIPTSRPGNHAAPDVQQVFPADADLDLTWPDPNFLPKDVPPMAFGTGDPFQGFDIPFWFGQDNYVAWMGNET